MSIFSKPNRQRIIVPDEVSFDLLRSRLEVELLRPAVIAITAATTADGKEYAAKRLAQSLSLAGYGTVLIDATVSNASSARVAPSLDSELSRQLGAGSSSGILTMLNLSDVSLQQQNGQRNIETAFATLRSRFEYSVVSVERGLSTSFSTSLASAADAVLVTVRAGRREISGDKILAEILNRPEIPFLGIASIDLESESLDDHFAVSPLTSQVRRSSSVDHATDTSYGAAKPAV